VSTSGTIGLPVRNPARRTWVLNICLAGILLVFLVARSTSLTATVRQHWGELLFWGVLIAIVNLMPVAVEDLYLTFDTPVVLATAFLYPPETAALVALIATVDAREFGRVPAHIPIFNRMQTALAVFLAGTAFRAIAGYGDAWLSLAGTAAALAIDYLLNVTLIVIFQVQRGTALLRATSKLKVGNPGQFLAVYLSYGALALVFSQLFREVGGWAVVTLLVPIFVARQMLVRGQEVDALNRKLIGRERLMEQLLDRAVDERKDERLRIAAELHDNMLQSLTRVWMLGQGLRKEVSSDSTVGRDVEDLVVAADVSMNNLRELMSEMRDSPLGRAGLIPTLESLIRDLRLDWGVRIAFSTPARLDLPPETQVALYQVAREALINALKHAEAKRITVSLEDMGEAVMLLVDDDGCGFDPDEVDSTLHFGLGVMQERVRRAGGRLRIQSRPGYGTSVSASVSAQAKQPSSVPWSPKI
jgi:signal transduction histidine kinase